jgi:hypothetical protein
MQVITDDSNNFRPVIGGYVFENIDTRVTIKFKATGEFLFIATNNNSSDSFSDPIRITVTEEQPIPLLVNDDGFMPKVIQVDEGASVKWSWSKSTIPHSIYEAKYCDAECGLVRNPKKYLFYFKFLLPNLVLKKYKLIF